VAPVVLLKSLPFYSNLAKFTFSSYFQIPYLALLLKAAACSSTAEFAWLESK
jgi:hypothetical protein